MLKRTVAVIAASIALWPSQAVAMPQFIAGLLLPLVTSSPIFFLGPAAISAVSIGLGYAAVIGVGLLAQTALGRQPAPKPEDVQTNFRQATPVRVALYGQGLLGGPWVFGGVDSDGYFHRIVAIASRQIYAIDEIWIDDIENVSLSASILSGGYVTSSPYGSTGGGQWIFTEGRLGTSVDVAYSILVNAGIGWTAFHLGYGIASIYTRFTGPDVDQIQKLFPNGINTLVRARCRGCLVWDPNDGGQDQDDASTWTYSDNAARVILDYARHPDGFRIPDSLLLTPLAIAGWQQATTDCGDAITLKAGGIESRYRIWGSYAYNERPADVLRRFMQACNARLKPVPDGGYTIEVGKWRAPEITIDETHIVGWSDLSRGRDILQTANTIYSQYTSIGHGWQGTDAQPWVDTADVSDRGEISASVDFINAPSHGQCRRLMKIEAHRADPDFVGTFVLNKAGVICFGERFINMSYDALGVSGTYEVLEFKWLFGEHGILRGCQITVQSISSAAYDWDAATEEGEPGGTENPPAVDPWAAPELTLTMQAGSEADLDWGAPVSGAFSVTRIQYQNTTTMDPVVESTVASSTLTATITGLTAGDDYQFRIRHEASLSQTEWSDWESDTALA
ncbi:fibronectin type III domain-containing protein [Mesorhizobium sp. Z1-4]|uniref:fibronectin type III domain-containing protein n=1 Tax=Mesorhizobium sp. Z1-4 TaxID=2448478 RepID=UPI000FD91E24|nr:fibronectin type III domain-containing protein [Mesorhizobium sp. Z1-4]